MPRPSRPTELETSLTAKLNSFISDANGDAGLMFALSQQSGRTALFTFSVNLTTAGLAQQSWNALLGGSVAQALQIGGFTLLAGSGVSSQLKRSSAIQFHFFNLFKWDATNDYFSNAYTELAADGSIRVFQDIGQEQQIATKNALQALRIHFVATATEDTQANVANAEVDLNLELSESDDLDAANVLRNVVAMIPAGKLLQSAEDAIGDFLKANPRGTLNIINVLKPSAYEKISCSPYNGKTPPPLPQTRDASNWAAFQSATEALMPSLSFVGSLTFKNWMDFNSIANTNSTGAVPNRRNPGNPQAVPPSFFRDLNLQNVQGQATYFLLVSPGFLNLCEDLKILRSTTAQTSVPGEWNETLQIITSAVKNDLHIDYGKPTIGALLYLCTTGGAQVTGAVTATAKDSSTLTCTLTLA